LKYFSVNEPEMLDTIRTQVSDLQFDAPAYAYPSMSLKAVWHKMKENSQKALPVVDSSGRLIGLVTLSDLTRNYMDASDNMLLANSKTSFYNIIEALEAKVITGKAQKRFVTGRAIVAAQHHLKIKEYVEKGDVVIASLDENIRESIQLGASLIVCTCGISPEADNKELANKNGCVIISTGYDTFTSAMLIRQSVPAEYVMTKENIVSVRYNDLLEDAKDRMTKTRFRSYPVIGEGDKVVGMISRYHLLSRNRKQAVLLDHNERSQTANGIDEADVIEIIDHHRLGDIQTRNPILVKNEPVGSTATIIASIYEDKNVDIPPSTAGILLSAIISDTLNFKSPTSTLKDSETAKKLAEIADIDINDLAVKIFNAGSGFKGKTAEEIIRTDLKEYVIGKYRVAIAQVYSTDYKGLAKISKALMESMNSFCERSGIDMLMLLVTDLNRVGSEVFCAGEHKDLFYRAYSIEKTDGSVFLSGVLSRKKQVFPQITSAEEER
jgi:manganese-dependent inorganic pyrophosphatase